ncbi:MAG TPA: YeeE/YedE thiosulfate transporter family protein [Anaeromyxobacteraceae bacterium]|nr:YeeE/YedE thiosulfate transporter family protein [Anaeromyxobacteraceae bacterium]
MDAAQATLAVPKERFGTHERWALAVTGFFIVVSASVYAANELYVYLVAYLWFGFIYGMCLQGGRFCFSSAFRDLFAVGVPRMVVGIVIACVLFGVTSAFVTATGMSAFHPATWGIHNVIAGAVFGVGMVVAGGCASSSLYKTGEGNMASALVILSISVTQAVFVAIRGWSNKLVPQSWHQAAVARGLPDAINAGDGWMDQYLAGYVWNQPKGTYADLLGAPNESFLGAFVGNFLLGVVVPAALLLGLVYLFWVRKGFLKKWKRDGKPGGLRADLAGFWGMVASSKRTAVAGLILGIAAGLHMYVMMGIRQKFGIENAAQILRAIGQDFGISVKNTVFDPGYWYVTTQEAQWVGWVFQKLGWNNMDNIFFGLNNGIPNPLWNPADWMSVALIGGACVMALVHNEFKFKVPSLEVATWAIIGGFFMGVGSRLGLGCNVGAFFVRTANGDFSGWLFGLGMVGGAYLGVKFFSWWTERKMAKEMAAAPDLQL